MLLNALAFGIWAIFGLGLGTLLKNQVCRWWSRWCSTSGSCVINVVLLILATQFDQEWILDVATWLPGGASAVMVSPDAAAGHAAVVGGGATLLAYGRGRRRDRHPAHRAPRHQLTGCGRTVPGHAAVIEPAAIAVCEQCHRRGGPTG